MSRITSSIRTQNRTAVANLSIPGTNLTLEYDSSRALGNVGDRRLIIPVSGDSVPDPLKRIELEIHVAGRTFEETYPAEPNLSHTFLWDGRDASGRTVQGTASARIDIGYVYDANYVTPASESEAQQLVTQLDQSFGSPPRDSDIDTARAREEVTLWRRSFASLRGRQTTPLGFGGWKPNLLRAPDELQLTSKGTLVTAKSNIIRRLVNEFRTVVDGYSGTGVDFDGFHDGKRAIAPDGAMYGVGQIPIGDYDSDIIWKVDRSFWEEYGAPPGEEEENAAPKSAVKRVAGTGEYGYDGDGGPARDAKISFIEAITTADDGSVYIFDGQFRVIRRIDPTGTITTVAGTAQTASRPRDKRRQIDEQPTPNADLGVATETDLTYITDMATGPDGSLYFAEYAFVQGGDLSADSVLARGAIRRITPSGRIVPVAGAIEDWATDSDDLPVVEGRATDLLFQPVAIDVDSEGRVYALSTVAAGNIAQVVRVVNPSGEVRTYVGKFEKFETFSGGTGLKQVTGAPTRSPLRASETRYGGISDISVGPDDTLYVGDSGASVGGDVGYRGYSQGSVTAVEPDGSVTVVAGGGGGEDPTDPPMSGEPAIGDVQTEHLYAGPDNRLYYTLDDGLSRIEGGTSLEGVVPTPDAGLAHVTDSESRHLETRAAVLGTTRWSMEYDDAGRVEAFVDAFDNRTTVERDDDGHLSAIEAPTGQRTTFATDGNGHLSTVTFPDGRTVELDMTGDGLVEQITDTADNTTEFVYGDGGLERRIDPTGATTDLTATFDRDEEVYRLTRISPELRESTHEVKREDKLETYTSTCCGGKTASTKVFRGGVDEWEVSRADGGSRRLAQEPDPRFGGLAPVTQEAVETSPGGREVTTTTSRSVEGDGSVEPTSYGTFTETVSVEAGGETHTHEISYDGFSQFQMTTPEGRTADLQFDGTGYPSEVSPDGIAPMSISRDDRGRVTQITQDNRSTTIEYDDDGHLKTVTDNIGATVEYSRDEAGRVTTLTFPSGFEENFTYDANSNLTRLTRPNDDVHAFSSTARDQLEVYTPPEGGTETFSYDGDGLPTERTLPSGRTITNTFGPGKNLQSAEHPDATVTYTRDDAGRPTEFVRSPAAGDDAQTVSTVRDGRAIEELSYSGAVSGTFTYGIDALGRTTEITYPDGTTRAFAYDSDGLVTEAGQFSVTRDGPSGAVTEVSDGALTVSISYNNRGNVLSRTHSIDGSTFYEINFTYGTTGLLTERTETVNGTTHTEQFIYGADGQLFGVKRDGTSIESYEYDANGNRIKKTIDGTVEEATYQTGDRLATRGGTTYSYDADGFVTDRGGDKLTYSAIGELLTFTGTGGTGTVTYTYDGQGRRVARTHQATTTEYLYGHPRAPWQVSVVREKPRGNNSMVRTQYYYDPTGRLTALDRDGNRYYVATDQVGTPRIVIASDGTVVKTIDRTAFGEIRTDSAPDFTLHVGFAGGLADPVSETVRFGHRDYEPAAGRFLARDPLRVASGQYNFYAYGYNNPINFTDRNGLSCYWQEVWKDASNAVKYASPLKNAASVVHAGSDAAQTVGESIVDATTVAAASSQASKAVSTGPIASIAKSGASGVVSEATYGLATGTLGTGATTTTVAGETVAASGTIAAAAKAGLKGIAAEASFRAGAGVGAAVNNLPKLADSGYRSIGGFLGDKVYELAHGDVPFEGQPRGPPGGDSGDCGEKSPENC